MKRILIGLITLLGCAYAVADDSGWMSLFDGKTMAGWQANESPDSWRIEDGAIVTNGTRSHLFYVGDVAKHNFKNFVFSAWVKADSGANSGIYFHTKYADDPWPVAGYEAQVYNARPVDNGAYIERKMTGSIYAVRNTWVAHAKDNEWFEYTIKVSGKTMQTFINGALICEYTESDTPWRSNDKLARVLSSGTFAFQAHDPDSVVRYRDIKVKILPDNAPTLGEPIEDKELEELVSKFSNDNVPLIDVGIAQGPSSLNTAQNKAAHKYGVSLGRAFSDSPLDLSTIAASAPVVVINDKVHPPSVKLMKAAKINGAQIAFSSGGATDLDPIRLKQRLKAMNEAGLGWKDMWIPGM